MKTITEKRYTIVMSRYGRSDIKAENLTLPELIDYYRYTLEVGKSWEHEKGNHKINMNPRTVKELVKNLNWATNNAARDGYSGKHYSIEEL